MVYSRFITACGSCGSGFLKKKTDFLGVITVGAGGCLDDEKWICSIFAEKLYFIKLKILMI